MLSVWAIELPLCRGYYTLLAWLPSYFELSLGLNVESSSLLTLIPYLAMTAMTPFVGPIADGLVSQGWTVTNVRKLAQVGSQHLVGQALKHDPTEKCRSQSSEPDQFFAGCGVCWAGSVHGGVRAPDACRSVARPRLLTHRPHSGPLQRSLCHGCLGQGRPVLQSSGDQHCSGIVAGSVKGFI